MGCGHAPHGVNDPATVLPAMNASGAGRHGWAPTNSDNLYGDVSVCGCECSRSVCARACMMCAIYDKNI